MQNWSGWQGCDSCEFPMMRGVWQKSEKLWHKKDNSWVSPISALVSISCAAVLDQFPLVVGTEVYSDCQQSNQFCSFLGLFALVHAQDVQIRSTAQMVLPAVLLLVEVGTVPHDHPHATERIVTLRFAQQSKITLKIFLERC